MKKKILFTAFNLDTGGVEKCLVNLVNNINLENYDIDILLQVKEGIYLNQVDKRIKIEGYNLSTINNKTIKNRIIKKIVNMFKFIHIILKNYHKYDCSIYYATGYVPSSIIALFSSKNNIAWMHTNILTYMENYKPYKNKNITTNKKTEKFIKRILFRKYKKNVFVSNDALKSYLSVYPKDANKCQVINNYIDYKTILEKSKGTIDIKKSKTFTFVNIGRQTEFDKRISRIIDACEKLNKEDYKFKFLLVGSGTDTEKYKKEVKSKKLDKIITFIDNQKNPYPFFLLGDVFVLSSAFEGLPTTVLEALVLNIPILSTDISDVKKIINNKYGITVNNNNESIYLGMKEYLDNKPIFNKKFDMINYNKECIDKIERLINNE